MSRHIRDGPKTTAPTIEKSARTHEMYTADPVIFRDNQVHGRQPA